METKIIIAEFYFCASQCTQCYNACAIESENKHLLRCMELDKDCSEICRLSGQFLERDSESIDKLLKLAAEICIDCAAECEKHKYEHCKRCAAICRKCAEMCMRHELHVET